MKRVPCKLVEIIVNFVLRMEIDLFTGRGTNDVIAYRATIWFAFDAWVFVNRASLEPKRQLFFRTFTG